MVIETGGSSPLARGLRDHHESSGQPCGIIPARAGFTGIRAALALASEDHPRSRGVYLSEALRADLRGGSSPLARGLRTENLAQKIAALDHPRSRGVYKPTLSGSAGRPGSSPLARGLLRQHLISRHWRRIIPARAGFTARR